MAIGDLYELLFGQTWDTGGQEIVNVFFYQFQVGPGGSASDLVASFDSQVLPAFAAIQAAKVKYTSIAARNLNDPLDFTLAAPSSASNGSTSGEVLPPFVGWYFRYNRTRTDINHGRKIVAGIPESVQDAGVVTGAFLPTLEAAADDFEGNLVGAGANTYVPRIVRRLLDSGGHLIGYEPYPVGSVQYVRISSQNSRKR